MIFGKPSQEEMQARYRALAERSVLKNGELPTVPAGTQQVIYGQNQNSLGLNYGDAAPTILERNGRKYFYNPIGGNDYVFNERTGAFHSGGSDGGILMFSPAKEAEEDEDEDKKQASSGGSGGSGSSGSSGSSSGGNSGSSNNQGTVTYNNQQLPMGEQGILGSGYSSMANYTPVTMGQPQNSLVNTPNWMVQLDPNNAVATSPGQVTYGNNVVLSPYVIS